MSKRSNYYQARVVRFIVRTLLGVSCAAWYAECTRVGRNETKTIRVTTPITTQRYLAASSRRSLALTDGASSRIAISKI